MSSKPVSGVAPTDERVLCNKFINIKHDTFIHAAFD